MTINNYHNKLFYLFVSLRLINNHNNEYQNLLNIFKSK